MNLIHSSVRSLAWCIAVVILATAFASCRDAPSINSGGAPNDGPVRITTTTGMITDIVRQVVGKHAIVTGIMKSGVDPHLYKASRGDVLLLNDADVVFYNGLMLEGKMSDMLLRLARDGKPVFAVTERLDDDEYVMSDPAQHFDPHVWMDVQGWANAVRSVAAAMASYDAERATEYHANAEAYLAQLDELDAYARRVIQSIPENQRVLVTAHDAFGYMGRAYGLEVLGVQGISTESEAGLRRINDLVDLLVDRGIPAVFVETSVAQKNVMALVEGAASRGHVVKVGGMLFSDAMGDEGTYEGTYIGMIDHNVTTIALALGGDAPEKGLHGKLSHASQ